MKMVKKWMACLLMGTASLQSAWVLAQDTPAPTLAVPLTAPQYPIEARRYGIEGVSLVGAFVTETGAVTRVELLKSSGFNLLDAEAIRVIRLAKFTPARVGGVAQSAWFRVPIRFRLENPPNGLAASKAISLLPEQQPDTASPIAISITPDGLMYLGSQPMGLEDLRTHLKERAKTERVTIHLRADEDAPYGRVARVIVAAQSAGVSDIRFLVVRPQ